MNSSRPSGPSAPSTISVFGSPFGGGSTLPYSSRRTCVVVGTCDHSPDGVEVRVGRVGELLEPVVADDRAHDRAAGERREEHEHERGERRDGSAIGEEAAERQPPRMPWSRARRVEFDGRHGGDYRRHIGMRSINYTRSGHRGGFRGRRTLPTPQHLRTAARCRHSAASPRSLLSLPSRCCLPAPRARLRTSRSSPTRS